VAKETHDSFLRYSLRFSAIPFYSVFNATVTYELIQQITGWEYQRYVRYHVYHARHVHCVIQNIIILRYNIRNNTILNPLHGVAGAIHHEEYEDLPSILIDLDLLQSGTSIRF